MTIQTFAEARNILEQYAATGATERTGYKLDRMQRLLAFLGDPQEKFKAVHVAGTSGKTSTAYYAAALLRAAGYQVGLTVSPHTVEMNDRVQINGQPMPENAFCADLGQFLEQIKNSGTAPTYFELMVAFAFWEFARQNVDYAVVEVGIGGLLDSTNVMARPDKVAIITDIGFDHMAILGKTLPEIAAQKAGIIQHRNTVFVHQQTSDVMGVIRIRARQMQADCHILTSLDSRVENSGLPAFQMRNSSLALAAVEYIVHRDGRFLDNKAIEQALRVHIPGRMETFVINNKTVILDGAHNGQKMRALAESVRAAYPNASITCVLGVMESAESPIRLREILAVVGDMADRCVITQFSGAKDGPRHGVPVGDSMHVVEELGVRHVVPEATPEKAFQAAMHDPGDVVVVAGSLYLLNHIRPLVLQAVA